MKQHLRKNFIEGPLNKGIYLEEQNMLQIEH